MSSDLTWLLNRANTSSLVKRNGIQLSKEAGNLLNKQSLKLSGFSPRSATITPAEKGVVLTLKKQNAGSKVQSANVNITLKGNVRQVAKSVKSILGKYRPDLVDAALARVSRIIQSQGEPKPLRPKKVRGVSKK
ncbi:hypothetical protein HDV01_007095 [Terramyces sp. JEL0728]|nr:hypothetical protein HDV01_007095 [Terramyces sp. JEL0728]